MKRRGKRTTYLSEAPDADASEPAATPGRGPDPDDRVLLHRALGTLAPRQRAVIVLRYFEDLTEAQTAEALGIAVGTVKSQARDALRRLREVLPDLADVLVSP